MKYLKMLGLAVVAAAALTALVGAGSASATELCKANESPCSEANMYKTGQAISGKLTAGTEAVLTGTFSVKCKKSTIAGKTSNTGGGTETVKGPVETMTFTECGLCTVTVNKKPTLEIHANGSVTAEAFNVSINCLGVVCEYGGNITEKLTLDGSNTAAKITATGAKIPVTGGAGEGSCGKEGFWDAEYDVTPSAMWAV